MRSQSIRLINSHFSTRMPSFEFTFLICFLSLLLKPVGKLGPTPPSNLACKHNSTLLIFLPFCRCHHLSYSLLEICNYVPEPVPRSLRPRLLLTTGSDHSWCSLRLCSIWRLHYYFTTWTFVSELSEDYHSCL